MYTFNNFFYLKSNFEKIMFNLRTNLTFHFQLLNSNKFSHPRHYENSRVRGVGCGVKEAHVADNKRNQNSTHLIHLDLRRR